MSMREKLERTLFPFVGKPGRYAGGELGQVTKDHSGRVTYLHTYPDKYELGMSHVGMQILYHIINLDDRFVCERAFAPDVDADEAMRREEIPLFSLESGRPAREFDVIGFSLVDETVYTNMLAMLDLAEIPLLSSKRNDSDPIIIAGGPAAYNPEPIAPFVDVFFIGDAEIGLPELLAVIDETQGRDRASRLEALCRQVESVYVPRFYDDDCSPQTDFAPPEIHARLASALKDDYYPDQPLVPLTEITHEHLGVEIMRGCPQGCRFCMASPIYKPVRVRKAADIVAQVERQLATTGYNEVTLLSLSSSDYPYIEQLTSTLAQRLEPQQVSLALPSLRPGSISVKTLETLSRVRVGSLTIAPEAGTERLRLFIRKDFPDEAILDTVRLAFASDINSIKLYYMVGLPTETEEDLDGIVDLSRRIHNLGREYPGKRSVTVTLSPFVPKPHTPFQWDAACDDQEAFRRIQQVKKKLRSANISVRHNSTQLAQLVATLGRGDRGMARAILTAYRKGCRFDGWTEHFDWDAWQEVFTDLGIDCAAELAARNYNAHLPWSHIRKGQSVEKLRAERNSTAVKMKNYERPNDVAGLSSPEPAMQYGRAPKRSAGRGQAVAPTKNRIRLRWGRNTRFRYMSHLDSLRLIERTIRRADLPVAYSQGFNPTMKLSFGPALALGHTSESELLELVLGQNWTTTMFDCLRSAAPEGLTFIESRVVHHKAPSLSAVLNRASYSTGAGYWKDVAALQASINTLLSRDAVEVERKGKNGIRVIDIRPAIYSIDLSNGTLSFLLGIGEGGYARPDEIVRLLSEGLDRAPEAVPLHRTGLYRVEECGELIEGLQV